jgi:hypothetical protein
MARYGDWIYQYYRIAGATHHGTLNTLPREELRRLLAGNIICAKQRLDGFQFCIRIAPPVASRTPDAPARRGPT